MAFWVISVRCSEGVSGCIYFAEWSCSQLDEVLMVGCVQAKSGKLDSEVKCCCWRLK